MKLLFFKSIFYFLKLIRSLLFAFLMLLIILFITQYVDNPSQYPLLVKLNHFTLNLIQPLITQVKLAVPHFFNGIDYSVLMIAFFVVLISHFILTLIQKVEVIIHRCKEKIKYDAWRDRVTANLSEEKVIEIDQKFEEMNVSSTHSDRRRLIKEFALLKNKLDHMGQYMAFLSIDVVDSTGMKRDEDNYLISYDFDRYNDLLIRCLIEHHVVKYTMTPDGMMSCFKTVIDAVKAGQALLNHLDDFNARVKQIKQDFHVRQGVHSGFVYIDESVPLEQISDRTIDIAGHMQKHASANAINISASAISSLDDQSGFVKTDNIIDEEIVYEWLKSSESKSLNQDKA